MHKCILTSDFCIPLVTSTGHLVYLGLSYPWRILIQLKGVTMFLIKLKLINLAVVTKSRCMAQCYQNLLILTGDSIQQFIGWICGLCTLSPMLV